MIRTIIMFVVVLMWSSTAKTEEYRIDFPITHTGVVHMQSVPFSVTDSDPHIREEKLLFLLSQVINVGKYDIFSVALEFSKDGYLSDALVTLTDTPNKAGTNIRLLVGYYSINKDFFYAPEFFLNLVESSEEALADNRMYMPFKIERGKDTGVQTIVALFCNPKGPCPGQYPIITQEH